MIELIELLKKATEPSRELDGRIWAEIHNRDVRVSWCEHWGRNGLLARSRRAPHDECVVGVFDAESSKKLYTVGQSNPPPEFTKSIEAALTLVPDGWEWQASNRAPSPLAGRAYLNNRKLINIGGGLTPNPEYKGAEQVAATPAIAMCLAALWARRANEN